MPPLARVRTLPWLVLLELARTTKSHLDDNLSASDRKKVASIAKKSKGDVRKLSERDKAELKRIARDLNVALLARNVAPAVTRLRGGRRR
ncbi:MAG: hypothetical protein ACJ762_17730 [Solirubrobacteraceae bacterium]